MKGVNTRLRVRRTTGQYLSFDNILGPNRARSIGSVGSWNPNVPALEVLRQQFVLEDDGNFLRNWFARIDPPHENVRPTLALILSISFEFLLWPIASGFETYLVHSFSVPSASGFVQSSMVQNSV